MSECVVWSESATVRTLPRRKPTGRVRFITPDGMWHVYLNEAIPARGSIIHSPCDKCGFGYSENIVNHTCVCSECKIEAMMARVQMLEDSGVPMGGARKTVVSHREAVIEKIDHRHSQRVSIQIDIQVNYQR